MSTRTDTVEDGRGNVISSVVRTNLPEFDNREAMLSKAADALTANSTFLAIGSPSNAQNLAQIRLLTRQNNALIRLLLGLLDSAADT